MASPRAHRHPSPDAGLLAGVVLVALGYALPWFQIGEREWHYSGWRFTVDEGGGWTLITLAFLGTALVAAVWAGSNVVASAVSLGALLGAMFMALLVVVAALVDGGGDDAVTEMSFGFGLPLMAIGFGLGVVSGVVAIASIASAEAAEALRRRHFPG